MISWIKYDGKKNLLESFPISDGTFLYPSTAYPLIGHCMDIHVKGDDRGTCKRNGHKVTFSIITYDFISFQESKEELSTISLAPHN